MMKHKCLTIAGFDGSGGAGIQADLKTFSALGCYGMNVLTALPVQNTQGVRSCYSIPLQCIEEQLEAIFDDIIPTSIKIGMLFTTEIIEIVSDFLLKNALNIPIVVDPVMVAKSGDDLLQKDAIHALKSMLFPIATIITPNIPEALSILGLENQTITEEKQEKLTLQLLEFGSYAVLLKGGHGITAESIDYYLDIDGGQAKFSSTRVITKNTHGTGCTLSAAIAAFLALGFNLQEACQRAKSYLHHAIEAACHNSVGKGHGPVSHFYHLWPLLQDEYSL